MSGKNWLPYWPHTDPSKERLGTYGSLSSTSMHLEGLPSVAQGCRDVNDDPTVVLGKERRRGIRRGSGTGRHAGECWDKRAGLGGTVICGHRHLCTANPSPGQHCPPAPTELGQPAAPFQRGRDAADKQRPRESRRAGKRAAVHSFFPGRLQSVERFHKSQSPRARDRQDSQFLHRGCHPWEGTDWI